MLRLITSILLIFTILGHCFNNWGVYISYSINKDFIKEVLCINKDNEALQCDGKCYLKSAIEKNSNEGKKQNMPSPDLVNMAFVFPGSILISLAGFDLIKSPNYVFKHVIGRNFIGKILRPPPLQ